MPAGEGKEAATPKWEGPFGRIECNEELESRQVGLVYSGLSTSLLEQMGT